MFLGRMVKFFTSEVQLGFVIGSWLLGAGVFSIPSPRSTSWRDRTESPPSGHSDKVQCVSKQHFFRNPERPRAKEWTFTECSKYYLCLEGEVFEFSCSAGLLFDIERQLCDFKGNVHNCDKDLELPPPEPLLYEGNCSVPHFLACADGSCLNRDLFCDGIADCKDSSDENYCSADKDPNAAEECDPRNCKLPDCFCSKDGTQIPGGLEPKDVPQMIMLTFDDAVTTDNWNLYSNLLFGRNKTNSNGCPITATFYVSHEYTNYQLVQKLWNRGHEVAVHSITHRGPEEWWSTNATIEDWFDEMVGMSNILHNFGSIPMEEIRGLRVPFLRVGWNKQFLMMKEFGFVYDSSMTAPLSDPPLWPYTMDYRMPHRCLGVGQRCPSRSTPGLWEFVMNQLKAEGFSCAMVDSCPPFLSEDEIYRLLWKNFYRHYDTNRAPYGLYFHSSWFKRPQHLRAFTRFLDEVLHVPDVWVVNAWQALQWLRRPVPVNRITRRYKPWQCKGKVDKLDEACTYPKTCRLYSRALRGERFMTTCTECPKEYPWLKNELGAGDLF